MAVQRTFVVNGGRPRQQTPDQSSARPVDLRIMLTTATRGRSAPCVLGPSRLRLPHNAAAPSPSVRSEGRASDSGYANKEHVIDACSAQCALRRRADSSMSQSTASVMKNCAGTTNNALRLLTADGDAARWSGGRRGNRPARHAKQLEGAQLPPT